MDTILRQRVLAQYPAQAARLDQRTRHFAENIFLFDDPWDMEQCTTPVRFDHGIDWEYFPDKDPEWTYMLARHSYTLLLARAAVLFEDPARAEKAADFIRDFQTNAPLTEASKGTTWRSLDAGIRIGCWLDALALLQAQGDVPAGLLEELLAAARRHADYLLSVDTSFCRLSNWGIIQNAGLYQAALFLQDEAALAETERRLSDEVSLQLDPDGWHWEQSPMYHAEVLAALLRVVRLAQTAGRPAPAGVREGAQAMAHAMARSARPDHCQFLQSDSDLTDLRDLLTQAAILFLDGELKFHGLDQPDLESLFWMTPQQLEDYERLSPCAPKKASAAHSHSGNYYLRTGWTEQDSCLHFHCGNLGGGHGHADLLHIDLCALGQEVLVDSGRFTYVEGPDRLWFKSCAAHNTFTLDGIPFTECTHTWEFGQVALPAPSAFLERDGFAFAEGGHLGYLGLDCPAFCRRLVIQAGPQLVFLLDLVHSKGPHTYEGSFHFASRDGLALLEDRAVYQGGGVTTEVFCPGLRGSLCRTPYSPRYNHQEEKATLLLAGETEGLSALPTVFVSAQGPAPRAEVQELPVTHVKTGQVLAADAARAWQVTAMGQRWTFLFSFKDTVGQNDLLAAGDICAHGRVIAAKNGQQTVLAW